MTKLVEDISRLISLGITDGSKLQPQTEIIPGDADIRRHTQ